MYKYHHNHCTIFHFCFQAVPEDPTSFNSRKKLPADWCGLRDEILSEKVRISRTDFNISCVHFVSDFW